MNCLRITTCVLLFSAASRADISDTEKKLAGSTSQNWVAERVEMVMGTGGCTKGETWRFSADHSVEIRKCEAGKLNRERSTWSLTEENSLDTVLSVNGVQCYVTFYRNARGSYMQLKTIPAKKDVQRVNKEFRLEDE